MPGIASLGSILLGTPWYAPYVHPVVYTLPTHPGHTTVPHGEPGHATRQSGQHRLTALTRGVTELIISDERVTVASRVTIPVSLLVNVRVMLRRVSSLLPGLGERRACCAECPPSFHPLHCWTSLCALDLSSFCQESPVPGLSAGESCPS